MQRSEDDGFGIHGISKVAPVRNWDSHEDCDDPYCMSLAPARPQPLDVQAARFEATIAQLKADNQYYRDQLALCEHVLETIGEWAMSPNPRGSFGILETIIKDASAKRRALIEGRKKQ